MWNTNTIAGALRAVLPGLLGYVAGRGLISAGDIPDIITAVVTLGAAGWSIYSNRSGAVLAQAADHLQPVAPALATQVREVAKIS